MTNPILVIGGWAVDPAVLRPIFGKATYIDINHLMPSIVSDQRLISDWKQKLKDLLSPYLATGVTLAGWSTGAIAAAAVADLVNISKLVLFSATPSFCRRGSFRYGMRPQIIRNMITSIKEDQETVLKRFYYQCGFTDILFDWSQYSIEELTCGLQFLIHADLLSKVGHACLPFGWSFQRLIMWFTPASSDCRACWFCPSEQSQNINRILASY